MAKSKGLMVAAYYAGLAAKNANRERAVPDQWRLYAPEWLAGYDGIPLTGQRPRVART